AIVGLAPLTLARQVLAGSANSPGLFDRIGLLIEALRDGDPVFWTATSVCLLAVLVLLGVWAKTALEFRRAEARKRRRGGGRADAGGRQPLGRVVSSAPLGTSEKAVVIEVARLRWLLWTSVGLALAALGLYRSIPGHGFLEPLKAVLA